MSALSTPPEWELFLKSFGAALGSSVWPGNPGATEEALQRIESKLKTTLPPSYRAFLAVSNGWRNASRSVPVLRPAEKIRWFKREHPDWVEAYTAPMEGAEPLLPAEKDYFDYTREDSVNFDVKHLANTLCISDEGDSAVLLLNPMVVWPDGEWETWFFANWLPGATRYRSFADWMKSEFAKLCDDKFQHSIVPDELPTVYLDGPAKANRRVRPKEEILTFDQILDRLASKTRSKRIKAVRQLGRIAGQQSITKLIELLKSDYDYHVRDEAAELLGRLRAEQAVQPLIAVTAEQSHASRSAVRALGDFNDELSAKRLLQLVEEDGTNSAVAAYALAKRNDPRAVPTLVQKLLSKDPRDQHTGTIAGRHLADFQGAGYVALEPLVEHEDLEVRRRAIVGVFDLAALAKDKNVKLQARDLLKRRLEKESDEVLRRHLEVCIEVACRKKP